MKATTAQALARTFGVSDPNVLKLIGRIAEAELRLVGVAPPDNPETLFFQGKGGASVRVKIEGLEGL